MKKNIKSSGSKKTVFHFGITNRTIDKKYLLFLDYDTSSIESVLKDVLFLRKRYGKHLGNGYMTRTKHGFHVIFLEKHSMELMIRMMLSSNTDPLHLRVPFRRKEQAWVLRRSKKRFEQNKTSYIMQAPCKKQRSKAHAQYLDKMIRVPTFALCANDQGTLDYMSIKDIEYATYKIRPEDN